VLLGPDGSNLDSLIKLLPNHESLKDLVESKAFYIETMISAAISNHLNNFDVSQLIVTILSVLKMSTVWPYSSH
jgi:hypothetical protein